MIHVTDPERLATRMNSSQGIGEKRNKGVMLRPQFHAPYQHNSISSTEKSISVAAHCLA